MARAKALPSAQGLARATHAARVAADDGAAATGGTHELGSPKAPSGANAPGDIAEPGSAAERVQPGAGEATESVVASRALPMRAFSNSLPMELLRAREAVMRRFRPGLRGHGVTEQQWRILRALAHSGPLEVSQLADATCLLAPSLSRILPDMGVKVTFLREADTSAAPAAQSVTLVPQAAVKSDGDATFVFLVAGQTVERRAVRVGGTDGDRVEVIAGLKGGDRVVIAPPPELAAGGLIIVK